MHSWISRRSRAAALVLAGLALASLAARASAGVAAPVRYVQTRVIHVPVQGPLFGDLIVADDTTGLIYFSDLSNSSVDVIDGHTDRLLARTAGFVNGPGGLATDSFGQLWAGDGNRAVQVIEAHAPFHKLASVVVGAATDELGYDSRDAIIAVTSPDAGTAKHPRPFITLIDARPSAGRRYRVLGKIRVPGVPGGSLEQPRWDPSTGRFVESVRVAKGSPNGELALIDPLSRKLTGTIRLRDRCVPGGLAVGVADEVLAGCNVGGPELVNVVTGRSVKRFSGKRQCCADEVWFDALDGRYFAAEAGAQGPPPDPQLRPPAVEIIDARTRRVLTVIRLGSGALGFHQVAALGRGGKVFVPEGDGIHVFQAR